MNWLNDIIGVINNYLWSYVLIVMLIGIGLWFTVRTRFVQIRCIPEMFRLMTEGAGAKPREGHISTFQAFCVSTASRVGVGNIAAHVALAFGACAANLLGITDERARDLEPIALVKLRRRLDAAAEDGEPRPHRH